MNSDENKPFRLALLELRKRKALSQRSAARLLGVSPRTISQWERGKQAPFAYSQQSILDTLAAYRVDSGPDSDSRVHGPILVSDPVEEVVEVKGMVWDRGVWTVASSTSVSVPDLEFKA